MTNQVIPEQVVQAAARAGYMEIMQLMHLPTDYDSAPKGVREAYALFARAALEAGMYGASVRDISERVGRRYAHLYEMTRDELRAQAWDEGAASGWKQSGEGWNAEYPDESTGECSVDLSGNPYRTAK